MVVRVFLHTHTHAHTPLIQTNRRASTNSLNFYKCLLAEQCAGGRGSDCAENRAGPVCAICLVCLNCVALLFWLPSLLFGCNLHLRDPCFLCSPVRLYVRIRTFPLVFRSTIFFPASMLAFALISLEFRYCGELRRRFCVHSPSFSRTRSPGTRRRPAAARVRCVPPRRPRAASPSSSRWCVIAS